MDLKDMDLNLLVVFNQLLSERSVTATADKLGLSQPAVSNSLARLRKLLGDDLFVRTAQGMERTAFADQLAEPVSYALGMLHGAINQRYVFDPLASNRSFRIGMSDVGEIFFLPTLMDLLDKTAPRISLTTVRNTAVNLKDEMESGRVDLALGLLPQLKGGYFQRRLFMQRYVCMFRKGHALDKKKLSVAAFSAADHVGVMSPGTGHSQVDDMLKRNGVQRRVRLTVPHFVAVGHILQSTDLIATVPERFAQKMAKPFDLVYLAHPAQLPETPISLFWHARYHKDPANQWLRSLIFDAFVS